MAKPKGSKKLVCKCSKENYIRPGTKRMCAGKKCTRMLTAPKAVKAKKGKK